MKMGAKKQKCPGILTYQDIYLQMVHLEGIEPPTHGFGNRCSIQLSYRCIFIYVIGAPRGSRTPGLLIRSQPLYPAELWAHFKLHYNYKKPLSFSQGNIFTYIHGYLKNSTIDGTIIDNVAKRAIPTAPSLFSLFQLNFA